MEVYDLQEGIRYIKPDLQEMKIDLLPLVSSKFPTEQCDVFESEFSKFIGSKYAVSVGSGTAAIHLSLLVCGVKAGDEVITVPNTCTAVLDAILWTGATPVFVDIQEQSYNIDPELLEEAVNENTKAILPVAMYGQPADIDPILEIAQRHGISIIEDAAQSAGARYKGRRAGSFTTAGCFSFSRSKNLSVLGFGGMITTNSVELDETTRMLRRFGTRDGSPNAEVVGYRCGMSELHAMIGRRVLFGLDELNSKRRKIAHLYGELLGNIRGIALPTEMEYAEHVYCHYVIQADCRASLRNYLHEGGVETSCHYPVPLHMQRVYADRFGSKEGLYPITERVAQRVLSLPTRPNLTSAEVGRIAELVRKFYS